MAVTQDGALVGVSDGSIVGGLSFPDFTRHFFVL